MPWPKGHADKHLDCGSRLAEFLGEIVANFLLDEVGVVIIPLVIVFVFACLVAFLIKLWAGGSSNLLG